MFSLVLVVTLTLFVGFLVWFVTRYKKASRLPDDDVAAIARFKGFAQLAEKTYAIPSMRNESIVVHRSDNNYEFQLTSNYFDGKVWCWSCNIDTHPDVKYAIGIRGTHTVADLHSDFTLASGDNTGFAELLRIYVEQVMMCLEYLTQIGNNNGGFQLMLCGHSLGASIAEALHCYMHAEGGFLVSEQRITSAGVVTFDSPGQPTTFRTAANGFTTESATNMWTLNNRPNIINMLYQPYAKHFWVCGNGSQFHLADIPFSIIGGFLSTRALASRLLKAFKVSTEGHSITNIIEFVNCGDIHRGCAESWPLISGSILHNVSAALPAPSPPIVTPPTPAPQNPHVNRQATLPSLPLDKNQVQLSTPYETSFKDCANFFNGHGDIPFVLLPLISISGQGKTHTLAKLIDEKLDENLTGSPLKCFVGNGTNNSTSPILVYWKDLHGLRVYILDVPGVGEAVRGADDFSNLIVPLKDNVARVVVIMYELIHNSAAAIWASLSTISRERIRISFAFNAAPHFRRDTNHIERMNHYVEKFREFNIAVQDQDWITYCAFRGPLDGAIRRDYEYTITDLISHIERVVPVAADDICTNRMAATDQWWRNARALGKTAVGFIPIGGPLVNVCIDLKQGDFWAAAMDAGFFALDVGTLGGSSAATPFLKPFVSSAGNWAVKSGAEISGRTVLVAASKVAEATTFFMRK